MEEKQRSGQLASGAVRPEMGAGFAWGNSGPTETGRFGEYGGMFVPETVIPALHELRSVWPPEGRSQFRCRIDHYPQRIAGGLHLVLAERLTAECGGARIYLKREDLNHTGAHKINNAIGQMLIARRLGKSRVIAETGAGQHGVAVAQLPPYLALSAVSIWAPRISRDSR